MTPPPLRQHSDSGALGVVYACGSLTEGSVVPREELHGKHLRGIFGARDQFLAIVDNYEFDWQHRRDRNQVLEQETVTLGLESRVMVHQVAFGAHHRVALSEDGQLYSWGSRNATLPNGQLGQVASTWHPVTLTPRTAAVKADRTTTKKPSAVPENNIESEPNASQFDDREALLGSVTTSICLPRCVHTSKELIFKQVACGAHHSVAITDKGDLYAWGRNFEGQLGLGASSLPKPGKNLHNGICAWPKYVRALHGKPPVVEASCGDKLTVIRLANGSIWRFGERLAGVTHHPEEKIDATPRLLITSGSNGALFTGIATGYSHALAVTDSGELFAWGLNTYGQLGQGTECRESYNTPRPVALPAVSIYWSRVFAGGHYSAAIASSGQLFTWGNGHHGQLGHGGDLSTRPCEFAPRAVEALHAVRISSVVCDQRNLFAVAPTVVTSILPRAGETTGGYEMRIQGSGFWDSEDLTVRFVPRTEGRLSRGALGRYDAASREIVCPVPKFSLPGEFAVEVAMNGKQFTNDGHIFEAFKRPVVVDVSRWEVRLAGGEEFVLSVEGELPHSCLQPILAFVCDTAEPHNRVEVPGTVEKLLASVASQPESNSLTQSQLRFVTPTFAHSGGSCGSVRQCRLELSLNDGFVFTPIHVEASSSSASSSDPPSFAMKPPFTISLHDASMVRCRPNSFLTRSLPATIGLNVRDLLLPTNDGDPDAQDHHQLTVRLEITQLSVSEANAGCFVDVPLPVTSLDQQGVHSTLTCSVPPLSEWKLSKMDPKTQERVAIATDWWKFVPRWGFEAAVCVSMNGGRTILPVCQATCSGSVFGVFNMGKLLHASPTVSLLSGGTQVSIASDFFHFDTEDAVVLLKWRRREMRVAAKCLVPTTTSTTDGGHKSETSISLSRRLVFTTPSLPFAAPPPEVIADRPPPEDGDTPAVAPAAAAEPDPADLPLTASEEVDVFVSLDGRHFQDDSSLRLVYLRCPELVEITPADAQPGTRMSVKADKVPSTAAKPTTTACVRLTTGALGVSMIVAAELNEATNTIEFELPRLPITDHDVVHVAFSLDGQQFTGDLPSGRQQLTEDDAMSTSKTRILSFTYRAIQDVSEPGV